MQHQEQTDDCSWPTLLFLYHQENADDEHTIQRGVQLRWVDRRIGKYVSGKAFFRKNHGPGKVAVNPEAATVQKTADSGKRLSQGDGRGADVRHFRERL